MLGNDFHKLDILLLAGYMLAGLTPNEEFRIWIMCGIGGILSGFVGSELFTAGPADARKRWAVNACISVLFAPFATLYVQSLVKHHLPNVEAPLPFIAIGTSAILGILGVTALTWFVPFLKRKYGKQKRGSNESGSEGEDP